MPEGGCRGCISLDLDDQYDIVNARRPIVFCFSFPHSSPDPSCGQKHRIHRISKRMSRGFAKSFSPENSFRKTESFSLNFFFRMFCKISSNFVQDRPHETKIQIFAKKCIGAKRRWWGVIPAKPNSRQDFPRSAWLLVCQCKIKYGKLYWLPT